ncbi:DNA fragmentation factor subunit beta isoform X2 [Coturnix japonica]|uniref:DNA fragmentation factor subunit beta isoform X2 n=1 Tax=Coturnix japonica TaxID=93934 RepID=UPI0013A5D815|nr:DNA fragmentation factor subunit beta isoform X2 [Coturnix japonica]
MAAPLRPFRLRRPGSAQKFGAAAGSLRGLLRKGCRLLQLPLAGSRLCLYEDGTELSEPFFRTLSPHTELVLLRPGESWTGCCGDVERFLVALCSRTDAVVEAARRLLQDERAPRRQKLLADLIHNMSGDSAAERRDEDGKWFEARDAYRRILELMSDKLKSVRYNGSYFDRTEEEAAVRLCTKEGWFSCQGPFDRDDCPCKHSINPYTNRESRILFSTWNLDHIIEKKRSVVPELAEAVKTRDGREVNWEYFYQLLFTVDNLKLVHIACHKKTNHNLSCDKTKIYRKRKQSREIS